MLNIIQVNSGDATAEFLLGIDGGGSKTVGRLYHCHSKQSWQLKVGRASFTNDYTEALVNLRSLVEQLCQMADCQPEQINAVMGIAGALSVGKTRNIVADLAINFNKLKVVSDATTSLYGANLAQPVVAIALGTGSVAAKLSSSERESIYGGWGFTVGDGGSGAQLGISAIKVVLSSYEHQRSQTIPFSLKVMDIIGSHRAQINQWLALATPTDFAKLAPIVFEFAGQCPIADTLLAKHWIDIQALINLAQNGDNLPVVLLGGLAKPTLEILSEEQRQMFIAAKGDAVDGACLLASRL